MVVLQEIRRHARHALGPFLGICLVIYFAYHTVQGERGLLAWWRLRQDIRLAEGTMVETAGIKKTLEHRVSLLRPDHLDPDMLEERARLMLNWGREDEIVVLKPASR